MTLAAAASARAAAIQRRLDPQLGQHFDQGIVDNPVSTQPIRCQRMTLRHGKAVRHVEIVHDGPAAAGATNHGRTTAGLMLVRSAYA